MRLRALAACGAVLSCSVSLVGCTGASRAAVAGAPPSRVAVRALLADMTRAVRTHSSTAYAGDLDTSPAAAAFRQQQLAAFANLQQLPIRGWSYRLGPRLASVRSETDAARRTYGAPAVLVAVQLSYRLLPVDRVPDRHELYLTIVSRGGSPVVAADDGLVDEGRRSWQPPWSFGPIAVRRCRVGVLMAPAADAAQLPGMADALTRAVAAVSRIWPRWARAVAVVVVPDVQTFTALTGLSGADRYSAAAVTTGVDPVSGLPYGQRLVVPAPAYARLTAAGRQTVLRHEITHLATAAATSEVVPRWLVEGFAEYVAHAGQAEPVRTAASELRAQLAGGSLPMQLPADAAFQTQGAHLAADYEASWLACRLIAQRYGAAALVRLYRTVGASLDPEQQALAGAMRRVLHTTVAAFTAAWRDYLRQELR